MISILDDESEGNSILYVLYEQVPLCCYRNEAFVWWQCFASNITGSKWYI